MPIELQTQQWPAQTRRAILLVHGVGNAGPGDYLALLADVKLMLGDQADGTVIYQLWYDQVNDWFAAKTDLGDLLASAVASLRSEINDPELGEAIAETVGDVLWPVLVADARAAVREVYVAQLKQIVLDGINAGVPARRQKLSIICHSLGCFHTYEALHHIARFPSHALQPATHEVRFANVIFMASPVQLIRTVADKLGSLVPNRRWLYAVQGDALSIPFEKTLTGMIVPSVRRWVSITGDLDPVGGFFFRNKAPWAYMQVAGQESRVDDQSPLNISSKQQLAQLLRDSRRTMSPPLITASNPHSWENYVRLNSGELRQWIAT
ncbi:MAG: hypothetical protein IT360_04360 [Gemmatimonadaceae bacterium]|nr:hypothetical protein [Gemmatimonadaceae bacterium]